MLNNLLDSRNNVAAGIPNKAIGEQNKEEIEILVMEKKQQKAKARNALSNLLGARNQKPPPSISLPEPPESKAPAVKKTTATVNAATSKKDNDDSSSSKLPLNKDPRFEKYFRMLKVGMPLPHVKHAMQRDGLDGDILDQDHNQPAAITNSHNSATAAEAASAAKRQPRQRKKQAGPRRARFRWNKISNFFTESIWGDLSDDETIRSIDIDEEEFTELFEASATRKEAPSVQNKQSSIASCSSTSNSMKSKKKKKMVSAVRVIDAKRANNGGISLARVKTTYDEMSKSVDQMDLGTLTAGQIENMIEYLPTKEEQEKLTEYMLGVEDEKDLVGRFNSLCECEKVMVSIMTVQHPKEKLDAMHFMLDFQASMDSIVQDADLVDKACDELRNSTRLKKLLGIVLEFGNKLNTAAQGPEDKANAFALDSLLKLKQTKAFDKKTTFLNYIVSIVERNDESLLDFAKDIQTVIKAEGVYWDGCVSAMKKVEKEVENLRRMALYEAQTTPKNGSTLTAPDSIQVPKDQEADMLKSTSIGRFTMDALTQLSQLHIKTNSTMEKFQNLLIYFGEDVGERPKRPHELFSIFSQFSRDFEQARPKQKKRSFG